MPSDAVNILGAVNTSLGSVNMNSLSVTEIQGSLVIDSRLVATELGVNHSDWFRNVIKKYQAQVEQAFGILRFENGKPETGSKGGRPEVFAWLTEEQSTFYMTLSRNTDQVVQCKSGLVAAFTEAKKRVQQPSPNLTPIQILAAIAQQMAEQERQQLETQRQLDLVKSDVATIKQIQSDAELALKELPPATKPVPVKTTRSSLNKLIREYCHKTSIRHNDAWRELYREFRYRFHIDLGIRAANGRSAPLDVAESLDVIDDLYALACEMFKGGER
ncbi:Rha family transcriptional regulator [Nostoc piscinale]|uniref:Rha family transcriptional regulator n=1 Tax=Nostoc piscinale TaxID=224012 RepID=UPI0007862233|nr:Rha family transcriptional regulator [Nostoc piscinale]